MSMLQLTNISHSFPGSSEPILKNINLQLTCGECCVVIGANGSGKSTLIKLIAGDYKLNSGKILINGQDYSTKDRSRFISQVVQDINKGTIPEMSLLENMALSATRTKGTKLAFYQRYQVEIVQEIKSLNIGLEQYLNQPLFQLSGGQRQVIATLMAIFSSPQFLLLDEHTSALDPKLQAMLMQYSINAIEKYRITSIMITHKMDDAIKYGDRLILLHHGQIVLDLTKAEKAALTVNTLLALFHQYEDLNLVEKIPNER